MWEVFLETLVECVLVLAWFAMVAYGLALIVTGGRINRRILGLRIDVLARLGSLGGSAAWAISSAVSLSGKAAMTLAGGVRMASFLGFAAAVATLAWWMERRLIERRARRLRPSEAARTRETAQH